MISEYFKRAFEKNAFLNFMKKKNDARFDKEWNAPEAIEERIWAGKNTDPHFKQKLQHFKNTGKELKKVGSMLEVLEKIPQFSDDIVILGSKYKRSREAAKQQAGMPKQANEHWREVGARVEMEHTKDLDKAREIAQDHLDEDPDYYKDWDNKEKLLFKKRV